MADLGSALAEVEQLKGARQDALDDAKAVRQKLHNAIKKGKALEAEKQQKTAQIEALQQELSRLTDANANTRQSQTTSADAQLLAEHAALQERLRQLTAGQSEQEAQRQHQQELVREKDRELASRLEHAQYLQEALGGKQRELAAQQGEVLLLKVALEAAQGDLQRVRESQQKPGQEPDVQQVLEQGTVINSPRSSASCVKRCPDLFPC